MHMFTVSDDGPNDFSVLMSHADARGSTSLIDFAHALVEQLKQALPSFRLTSTTDFTLDDEPAIELAYRWRSDGGQMYQRQAITFVPGPDTGSVQALLIAASAPIPFSQEWNAVFDGMLASVKLRHKLAPASHAPVKAAVAVAPTVFALSERRRTLHAFADHDEACRKTDAREVEQGAWAFFDAAGRPLHVNFVLPASANLQRQPGRYVLELHPDTQATSLHARLHLAAIFVAGSAAVRLSSIADVRELLDQTGEG